MAGTIHWSRREPPLTPAAVTVPQDRSTDLLAAVRRRVEAGAQVRVVAGSGRLLVLAQPEDLPWCPGARYLGWDGVLLLPTELVPSWPIDLLQASVDARAATTGTLALALLPDELIVGDRPRRPVDLAALTAMLARPER